MASQEDIDEIRESLGTWHNFLDDMGLLFKSMGQKFQRKSPKAASYIFDENKTSTLYRAPDCS